ncbi:MAG: hypothetical protein ACOYD6_00715 [Limnochordia bacterium]|jgi:hypothetical protein
MGSLWALFITYVVMAVLSAVLKGLQGRPVPPDQPPEAGLPEWVPEAEERPAIPRLQVETLDDSRWDEEFQAEDLKEDDFSLPMEERPVSRVRWSRNPLLQGFIMAQVLQRPRAQRPIRFGDL